LTELSIRPAAEADVPAVVALARACVAEMLRRGIDQWDEVYPPPTQFSSDASAGSLYVASLRTDIVGALALDERQDAEYEAVPWTMLDGRVAVVHRLMVHPAFQGRGIAKELMRFAERKAADLGCGAMRLDAYSRNPQALRLYRTLGYRAAGDVVFRKGVFRCFEKGMA
jgi:GNAT superfamily N-acetyltransferase